MNVPLKNSIPHAVGLQWGGAFIDLNVASFESGRILPPVKNSRDVLLNAASSYNSRVKVNTAAVRLLDATLDVSLAASAVMSGGTTALLSVAAAGYAKKEAIDWLLEETNKGARILLKSGLEKFQKDTGTDYETLRTGSFENIRSAIENTSVFKSALDSVGDDQFARDTLQNAIASTIQGTELAKIHQMEITQGMVIDSTVRINAVGRTLFEFRKEVLTDLKAIGKSQDALAKIATETRSSVKRLEDVVNQGNRDAGAIEQMMFNQAPTSEKLRLLRGAWKDGDISSESRQDLITFYEGQQAKEAFVDNCSKVADYAGKIGALATRFGCSSPELSQTLGFASSAAQIASSLTRGDFIGAALSASSLFGGGDDGPSAQQKFLQQSFAQINSKLDEILENQKQLLQATVLLSEQIGELGKALGKRLDTVDFKLESLLAIGRQLLFQTKIGSYNQIRGLVAQAIEEGRKDAPDDPFLGGSSSNVDSFRKLQVAWKSNLFTELEVASCLSTLSVTVFAASQPYETGGGNPLSVYVLGRTPSDTIPDKTKIQIAEANSNAEYFTKNYKETLDVVTELWRSSASKEEASHHLFAALASPCDTIGQTLEVLARLFSEDLLCKEATCLGNATFGLTCAWAIGKPYLSSEDWPEAVSSASTELKASDAAFSLLRTPLIQDDVQTLADAIGYLAPFFDTWGSDGRFAKEELDLIGLSNGNVSRGFVELRQALKMMEIAIAQSSLLFGNITAMLIESALWDKARGKHLTGAEIQALNDGDVRKRAYRLLASETNRKPRNLILAANVVMWALNRKSVVSAGSIGETLWYEFGLKAVTRGRNYPVGPSSHDALDQLFGIESNSGLVFGRTGVNRSTGLICDLADPPEKADECVAEAIVSLSNVELNPPEPVAFRNRQMLYPERLREMQQCRERLARQVADYQLFNASASTSGLKPIEVAEALVQLIV